jgi:Tfp pilus assembly protein PilN
MHINLIFEEEQRSASPVSLGLIIRLFIIAAVVLLMVGAVSFYSSYRSLQSEFRGAEDEWRKMEPRYRSVLQLRNDREARESVLREIEGWRDSRITWGNQLSELQHVVPAVIQLTELHVGQTILSLSNNVPARAFELRVTGKTAAARSEANVVQFMDGLKQPPFTTMIESVVLPPGVFRQDPGSKTDRIFEIVCKYFPRALE